MRSVRSVPALLLVMGLMAVGCSEVGVETTTTAVGPWTTVPTLDPPDFVLGAGFEELATIDAFCVSTASRGVAHFSEGTRADLVTGQVLEALDQAAPGCTEGLPAGGRLDLIGAPRSASPFSGAPVVPPGFLSHPDQEFEHAERGQAEPLGCQLA